MLGTSKPSLFVDPEFNAYQFYLVRSSKMKYPVLLVAVALFVSFVVSETLRNDATFSYSSEDNVDEVIRTRRSPAQPAAVQPAVENINYRPYSQVPSNIKQLLQFQQTRETITHIAAQAPPQLAKAPTPQSAQYNPQVHNQHAAQSQSQPQAQSHPQYQSQSQANYQSQQSPVYRPNPQQVQPAYNHQQQQQFHGNQQQGSGPLFRPEQRPLY